MGDDSLGIKGISGGERRRLSVAIGLVTDPQIILLDEPTSGLDSETAGQLIACLVRLAQANRTVGSPSLQPIAPSYGMHHNQSLPDAGDLARDCFDSKDCRKDCRSWVC